MRKLSFIIILALMLCLSMQAFAVSLENGQSLSGGVCQANGDDESAVEVSGTAQAELIGVTVQKTGGKASSTDSASFCGLNAAVRVYDSTVLMISGCQIEASASNATGVFAYDRGTVYIENSSVNVTGGGAGGVQVAGGGTLIGQNLTVTSASKAAIRSDRGGGTMELAGGTYISTGSNGCPAIYSTADITVKDANCISEASRAVIIEGKNSVSLENCTLSGNDQSTKQNSVKANVLLYQSASGDARDGTSVFSMTGGEMTANSGAMFYCTNTSSEIWLNDAELNLSSDRSLLIVAAGCWGKEGKNGGHCALNAKNQMLEGSITVDAISELTISLNSSTFIGAINADGQSGAVQIILGAGSAWTLTGDSYITSLEGETENIDGAGYHLYVNGEKVF